MIQSDSTITPRHFCIICHYPLDGLSASRCPECGRPFDLKNPATYHLSAIPPPSRWPGRIVWLLTAFPLLVIAFFYLTAIVATTTLGHWPHPYRDDPKGLGDTVGFFQSVTYALLIATPAILIATAAAVLIDVGHSWRRRHPRPASMRLAACLLSWILSIAMLRADPLRVAVWFFD